MEKRPHYGDYFLACVRVSLSNLSYDGRPDREEKKEKINKLHSIFEQGCNRTDPDNFINAIINREIFESIRSNGRHLPQHFGAWQQAPQPSSLVKVPAGIKLCYGDGFSRVEACKLRFRRNLKEHWWVVNLLDEEIGRGYLLSQTYRNSRSTANPSGVEIRNYLNLGAQVGQVEAKQIELSLSTSNRKGLKAIRTRSDLDKALVALKEIPALWGALKGGLYRISLYDWDYENTYGLKGINTIWVFILRDGHRFIDIDAESADKLGGRVPGRSIADRQYIIDQMKKLLLFSAETDVPTRERLENRILSIKTIIPTFKTYSWDTLHLRELGTILRLLLSPDDVEDGPRNIRSALRDIWEEPETGGAVLVEDLEDGVFSKLTVASQTVDVFEIQLQSLVLHAMRNYTKLGGFSPKTIPGEPKVQPQKPMTTDLYRFAETARILGFRSVQYMLTPNKALRQDCENFVTRLNPRDIWEYDVSHVVDSHCRIQGGLKTKRQIIEVADDLEVRLSQRFGRPTTAVLDGSARYMFLRYLSSAVTETSGVTNTFVRMEFFRRFWDPIRTEVGDFSEVGMIRISTLESEPLETPSTDSDDGFGDERRLMGEQEIISVREDLQTARNQIQNLETLLEGQNAQIDEYSSEMSQKHRELGELRKDNELKLAHINKVELQAKADKDVITKLSESDKSMRSAKEEAQLKTVHELEQQICILQNERGEEEQKLQVVRNQVTKKDAEVEALKKRLTELESLAGRESINSKRELLSQTDKVKQLQNELQSKDEQLALNEKEVQGVLAARKMVEEKEKHIEELQNRYKDAEDLADTENRKLREGLRRQEEQIELLQKDIDKKEELQNRYKDAEDLADTENQKLREGLRRQEEQIELLQKDIDKKDEQLASIQESLITEEKHVHERFDIQHPKQTAEERKNAEQYLEQQIENLIEDISYETQKIESTREQIKQIAQSLEQMNKAKKGPKKQSKEFDTKYDAQKFKHRELQKEIEPRKMSILALKKRLTNKRYELLGLKEGEALIYERHPVTKEIISQTPARIPLTRLYTEFNNLNKVSEKYRVLCKRNGISVTLGFNTFHEWQKCLADPPVIDDATFYVENLSLKRKAADEQFLVSKRVKA